MKLYRIFTLCLVLALTLTAFGCAGAGGGETTTETTAAVDAGTGVPLGGGVYITGLFPYTGAYVEDGEDAPCENVAAVRLVNRSATHYQRLTFTVETTQETYSFEATTLFVGAHMTVLNSEKKPLSGDIVSAHLTDASEFLREPTVHLDTLEISYTDGFLNVKNISGRDLDHVRVYYKSTDDNGFFGGITYRVNFDRIAADAIAQAPSAHLRQDGSRVVFATYDE